MTPDCQVRARKRLNEVFHMAAVDAALLRRRGVKYSAKERDVTRPCSQREPKHELTVFSF